uniref:Uncharacterized protein n=1 Tax=Rhizophora mucronata TaxID=61149 RepID=A0A2P2NWJ2_RHIMU
MGDQHFLYLSSHEMSCQQLLQLVISIFGSTNIKENGQ